MKNQIDDVLNSKIGKQQFLIPLITIIAFVLVIGGVSYAYFGFTSVTNNVIYANVSTPTAVNKSLSITKSDCELSIDMSKMAKNENADIFGTIAASSNCYLKIDMEGAYGDYCTYKLKLESIGETYTAPDNLPNGEMYGRDVREIDTFLYTEHSRYTDGSDEAEPTFGELFGNIDVVVNYLEDYDGWILVSNDSDGNVRDHIYVYYTLDLTFYNLPTVDQTRLIKSTTAPTIYKWQLKVTDLECNWNH